MLPVYCVLHPTDFSEGSDFAFRLACSLARDYGARLVVLHVAPSPAIVYGSGVVPPHPEEDKASLRERLGLLQPRDRKTPVEHVLAEGDAAGEILRVAREKECDVIVLGTHGRTGLGRLLMGSVAEQVVRRAPCPVVTVKAPPAVVPAVESATGAARRSEAGHAEAFAGRLHRGEAEAGWHGPS